MTTNFYFPGILCNNSNNNKELKELPILTAFLDSYTGNIRSLVLLLVPLQIQEAFPLKRYQPREGRYQLNSFCASAAVANCCTVPWAQPDDNRMEVTKQYTICSANLADLVFPELKNIDVIFYLTISTAILLCCHVKRRRLHLRKNRA